MFRRLTLQSKLILILLAVSLLTAIPLAYIGYSSGRAALEKNLYATLSSQLEIRTAECKTLLESTRNQVLVLSAGQECTDALQAFQHEFQSLQEQVKEVSAEDQTRLEEFYKTIFIPGLEKLAEGMPDLKSYYPTEPVTRYLQAQYIAKVVKTPEQYGKTLAASIGDGTAYDAVHAKYHPSFSRFAKCYEFEDIMLVDMDGNLVYTYQKTVEFGTDLLNGPYAESNVAQVVNAMRKANSVDSFGFTDFERYQPNMNLPSAFMASPIFSEGKMVGTLVLQFTTDGLSKILTGDHQWERQGLGKTGEVYMIGKDKLFRTRSRFMITDPEEALESFEKAGIAKSIVDRIQRQGIALLALPADTEAVNAALTGETGIKLYRDYRHSPVIGAYAPFDFDGTRWAVVAEMDEAEAFQPSRDFTKQVLVTTVGTCIVIMLLGMLISQLFVAPIHALTNAALRISEGEIGAQAVVDTSDEFRELANAFNEMSLGLKEKTDQLQSKVAENEELLLNILPAPAAARLKEGDHTSTQAFSDVSVLFAQVAGLENLTDRVGTEQAMSVFRELVIIFDDAADRFGAEKVTTSGVSYLAVCGLSVPRPDHTNRLVDFASELLRIVERFNRERGADLHLLIGINNGPVTGGVVGRSKFIYDLWGDTVTIARALGDGRESGVCVTRSVYDRVRDQYSIGESKSREIPGKGLIEYWPMTLS